MKISSKELEASKVRVIVDKNPVATSFEKWAQPGHFSRTLAKGPKTTTWIWNLHADAHDFDSQTSSLEDISRKIFSAHFGQLSLIFIWISQAYFHGARFSNYSAWLSNPTTVKQSSQVVWPVVGQEILNGDVGGGFSGVQVTSGWFQMWRAAGITNEAKPTIGTKLSSLKGSRFCFIISSVVAAVPNTFALPPIALPALVNIK